MLYIANTTKQHYRLYLQVPENKRPFTYEIYSGEQVEVGHNWNHSQLESVIKQLEGLGAVQGSHISAALTNYSGLLYRTDKAVTESQIHAGHDAVVDAQERRSAEEAERGAKGFDIAHREGKKARGKRLAKVTEVEVSQEVPKNQKPGKDDRHFKMTIAED
jgi:hypothetical protein